MTRTQWMILIVAFLLFVIWRFFAALIMLRFAIERGDAGGKRFRYFMMCVLLGLPAYLYIISLPDWKVRYSLNKIVWLLERNSSKMQSPTNSPLRFPHWPPEVPKQGVSTEAFLQEISKVAEEYTCDRLIIVKEVSAGECYVCKRKQKEMKHCRIIHNGTHKDVDVCTDCINVFIEHNPESVFDLNSLGTQQQ